MNLFEVIKRPHVTEKASALQAEANRYSFAVDPRATKRQIRDAVERIFKVRVEGVRTMNLRGKFKRVGRGAGLTSDWKKAVVTLKEGDKIEALGGA